MRTQAKDHFDFIKVFPPIHSLRSGLRLIRTLLGEPSRLPPSPCERPRLIARLGSARARSRLGAKALGRQDHTISPSANISTTRATEFLATPPTSDGDAFSAARPARLRPLTCNTPCGRSRARRPRVHRFPGPTYHDVRETPLFSGRDGDRKSRIPQIRNCNIFVRRTGQPKSD